MKPDTHRDTRFVPTTTLPAVFASIVKRDGSREPFDASRKAVRQGSRSVEHELVSARDA